MQFGKGSARTEALLALALGRCTCVRTGRRNTSYLANVSMMLATDGTGRAIEHGGNVAQAVVLLQQAGHGHTVFGLELLVAPGCCLHLLNLRGLQVLHFTFQSAVSFIANHPLPRPLS